MLNEKLCANCLSIKLIIISQNKGKESENSYQKLKRSLGQAHKNTRKLYRNILTGMAIFINQKRVNVCEHTTKMGSLESL